jgi:hypothetical protein
VDAIDAFCDPEIVRRRNEYSEAFQNAYTRGHEIESEMRALYDAVPGGGFRNRPDDLEK